MVGPQGTTVGYLNIHLFTVQPAQSESGKPSAGQADFIDVRPRYFRPTVITGLSMAAQAQRVSDPTEVTKAMDLLQTRYPNSDPDAETGANNLSITWCER